MAEGDLSEAWTLLNGIARASRHIERIAPTGPGRTHGIFMIQYARTPVAEWARHPAVSAELLRRALDDLAAPNY